MRESTRGYDWKTGIVVGLLCAGPLIINGEIIGGIGFALVGFAAGAAWKGIFNS